MQSSRTTTRRRSRAARVLSGALGGALLALVTGLLAPTPAGAEPTDAAQARTLMQQAAQRLTAIDAQLDDAEALVAAQQQAAADATAAATAAQQALDVYAPRIKAIAQTGFTGQRQSRVAAFLTSESADELVQQMTTLDVIAMRTNAVVAEVSVAQRAAQEAKAVADQAAAAAQAGLDQLQAQKAEAQSLVDAYQADFARLSAAEQAALTTAVAGRALPAPSADELQLVPGSAAAVAIQTALAQLGDPYVWGASGPDGFDCSGLTSYAYAAAGVRLPRSSTAQSQVGRQVSRAELQPGDLVFFYTPISHVGLYIGDGKMVHARTFGQPVSVASVDQQGYRFGVRLG